jgi:hypothetical protein
MTRRRLLITSAVALLSIGVFSAMPIEAQTWEPAMQEIRTSVAQAIGAEPTSVTVSIRGNVLNILRVNSTLNQSDHGARNTEASKIGPVVAKVLADRTEFRNVHTIRVQYVTRSKPDGTTKVVDTVDFRKAPGGGFVFHTT